MEWIAWPTIRSACYHGKATVIERKTTSSPDFMLTIMGKLVIKNNFGGGDMRLTCQASTGHSFPGCDLLVYNDIGTRFTALKWRC